MANDQTLEQALKQAELILSYPEMLVSSYEYRRLLEAFVSDYRKQTA